MKKTDYIFWSILAVIAIFYLTIGNDIYKEKHEMFKSNMVETNK